MSSYAFKNDTVRRLIPVSQFNKYHLDPSLPALRWLIFKNKNGFRDACIVNRGRRLLIDEEAYFRWLDQEDRAAKKGRP